jgi:hypothetical protein
VLLPAVAVERYVIVGIARDFFLFFSFLFFSSLSPSFAVHIVIA